MNDFIDLLVNNVETWIFAPPLPMNPPKMIAFSNERSLFFINFWITFQLIRMLVLIIRLLSFLSRKILIKCDLIKAAFELTHFIHNLQNSFKSQKKSVVSISHKCRPYSFLAIKALSVKDMTSSIILKDQNISLFKQ